MEIHFAALFHTVSFCVVYFQVHDRSYRNSGICINLTSPQFFSWHSVILPWWFWTSAKPCLTEAALQPASCKDRVHHSRPSLLPLFCQQKVRQAKDLQHINHTPCASSQHYLLPSPMGLPCHVLRVSFSVGLLQYFEAVTGLWARSLNLILSSCNNNPISFVFNHI